MIKDVERICSPQIMQMFMIFRLMSFTIGSYILISYIACLVLYCISTVYLQLPVPLVQYYFAPSLIVEHFPY